MILACALIVFLPHSHECVEMDCSVCAVIESSRKILLLLALSASFCHLAKIQFVLIDTHPRILSVRDGTPVGLKVKLSD